MDTRHLIMYTMKYSCLRRKVRNSEILMQIVIDFAGRPDEHLCSSNLVKDII